MSSGYTQQMTDPTACHPRCVLSTSGEHVDGRCRDRRGDLPKPGEEDYEVSLRIGDRYDGWEPWEDATWD